METTKHAKEGKEMKKKSTKELKSHESASRFMNPRSFSCRCRPSVIRDVLDKVKLDLSQERMNSLRPLNVDQFFDLPPYPQDNVLTLQILKCWQYERKVFKIGGKDLRISSDEIALLIGMPNRGEVPKWKKFPSSSVDAGQIKNEILNVSSGECSIPFVELFLKFLLSNLFFPSSNLSVPKELYTFAENVQRFSSFNWPAALCDFLMEQINAVAIKIRRNRSLGYINGFLYLLTLWFYEHTTLFTPAHLEARPRMLRWPTDASWTSSKLDIAFKRLSPAQVHDKFLNLKEEERHLLAKPDEGLSSPERAVPEHEAQAKLQTPVQYDVGPFLSSDITQQPAKGGINQSLEVIVELLRAREKWFREFQGALTTINAGVLNIQETMSGLQSSIEKTGQPSFEKGKELKEKYTQVSSPIEENIGFEYGTREPSPVEAVDEINEMGTYQSTLGEEVIKLPEEGTHEQFVSNLIERVKGRRSRRKRQLASTFAGFEFKRRKPKMDVVQPSDATPETPVIRLEDLPVNTEIVDVFASVEEPTKSPVVEKGLQIIISPGIEEPSKSPGVESLPFVEEPIIMCRNGHIACYICCPKLLNKCHVCSQPIGNRRCIALEKVIESMMSPCKYANLGCRAVLSFAVKADHEECCSHAALFCPISNCTFSGSRNLLFAHAKRKHGNILMNFSYNLSFMIALEKHQRCMILLGEDGHFFLLLNCHETFLGNSLSVICMTSSSPEYAEFSYELGADGGDSSLRFRTSAENIRKWNGFHSSKIFLVVPNSFFTSSSQLVISACIYKSVGVVK